VKSWKVYAVDQSFGDPLKLGSALFDFFAVFSKVKISKDIRITLVIFCVSSCVFSNRVVDIWNSLPAAVVLSPNVAVFIEI